MYNINKYTVNQTKDHYMDICIVIIIDYTYFTCNINLILVMLTHAVKITSKSNETLISHKSEFA